MSEVLLPMRAFVTGCAGFIGSHVTDRLLANGCEVVGFDDFSTGQRPFLDTALRNPSFRLVAGSLLDADKLRDSMSGADCVFHLAANADVRGGIEHTRRDLEQNTIATYNVLEAMRVTGARKICFSSTGSVYGEATVFPTPEKAPFPMQTSLYGASKLACEGMIAAYCEGFGLRGWIFRFVSILGERYSHGHVFDFYRQLRADPSALHVLGNGRQRKSYLHVQDCVDGILLALARAGERVNLFNLGLDSYCDVNDSIGWICGALDVRPKITYGGGERGWVGDSPCIFLDTARIRGLGWRPKLNIEQGVLKTVDYLRHNEWLLEARA